MTPEDRKRILAENLDVLAGAAAELDKIPPGWCRCFEKFLYFVAKWNRMTDHGYELRKIKISGLLIRLEWNIKPADNAIRQIELRLKSDAVHSCMICGEWAEMKAPLAGYTYCRDCYALFAAMNED